MVRTSMAVSLLLLCTNAQAGGLTRPRGGDMLLKEDDVLSVISEGQQRLPEVERERFARGVRQAAQLWLAEDGSREDFARFCKSQFVPAANLDKLFSRFENKLEMIRGHMNALGLELRRELDVDGDPLLEVDRLFAEYDPSTHVLDDLFKTKLAFVALLNYPKHTLEDLVQGGDKLSRREWAESRLTKAFSSRVPAEVAFKVTQSLTRADDYIAGYNVNLDHVVGADGHSLFRPGLKLISHWGLRDEIKAMYAEPQKNRTRQGLIQTVMERIIRQEIPRVAIDNPHTNWNPVLNTVDGKPADREPDSRYAHLLEVFKAQRLEDPYFPDNPSHILRRFNLNREIPEDKFVALLKSVLEAPVSAKVADLIRKRLGRPLEAFDIWYSGFRPRGKYNEEELDRIVRTKYPSLNAFKNDLPNILTKLSFNRKTAEYLASRIEIDPARGAGHAAGPQMRTESARLRTRVPKQGMDYKGFNIAMHELGHNVEQVFSLYKVDSTLLEGVPNTAFTEGFAFVFQARDMDVLGLDAKSPQQEELKNLDTFWATREIAGVALVDLGVWHWMYDHPEASPAELREAVLRIAREIWNTHFAPIMGIADSPLLAIYSHMVSSSLYLPDYPLGHIIAFQVEEYFKNRTLGDEMERMCSLGSVTPIAWMEAALKAPISTEPLIKATEQSVALIAQSKRG